MKIVDTMARRPLRRKDSDQLKLQVVQECRRRGASVAGVALSHGINANIVHRWLREHPATALVVQEPQEFVALNVHPVATQPTVAVPRPDIRVEVRRGNSAVVVSWPVQEASSCATWLREWLK